MVVSYFVAADVSSHLGAQLIDRVVWRDDTVLLRDTMAGTLDAACRFEMCSTNGGFMRSRIALALTLCALMTYSVDAVSVLPGSTMKEITVPAGTRLPVVLDTAVASNTSRVEQPVSGHLSRDLLVNGVVVAPAGSTILGYVTSARRSGKVKGRAYIGIRFTELLPKGSGERYRIQTAAIGRLAPATKEADAVKIAAPAAGGAIVGGLIGGGKGALVGTAVGGGAGTAVVLSTRGKEVGIARGSALGVRLVSPVTVKARV
jgi:hypothetical protein